MPTYEYRCSKCDHKCEFVQKITEGAKRKCPECGALKLVKQISRLGGIIFRGEGFHCNDYPKKT